MLERILIRSIFLFFLLISYGFADQVKQIEVYGNERVSDETIKMFTKVNLNDDIVSSKVKPPAIICVGKAVLMRQVLNWQDMLNGGLPKNIDPLGRDILTEVS